MTTTKLPLVGWLKFFELNWIEICGIHHTSVASNIYLSNTCDTWHNKSLWHLICICDNYYTSVATDLSHISGNCHIILVKYLWHLTAQIIVAPDISHICGNYYTSVATDLSHISGNYYIMICGNWSVTHIYWHSINLWPWLHHRPMA